MPRKYRNKKVSIDGLKFDSKKERNHYLQLKLLQKSGHITELKTQPKYEFIHNDVRICSYYPDFSYVENDRLVVVDVKSEITAKNPVYKLKKKMMKVFFDIEVKEV